MCPLTVASKRASSDHAPGLRHAYRLFRHAPALSAAVVASLALGILIKTVARTFQVDAGYDTTQVVVGGTGDPIVVLRNS